jgi:hypothetical protein
MNWSFTIICFTCVTATSLHAQNYSVDWHTIDGGGGTSTGGLYSVSGTIGQPDAGVMAGGNYSVAGGFWGIVGAVQTPGAPFLTVHRTPTNALMVSWPSPSTGFVLQHSMNLNTPSWTAPPETIVDDGAIRFIIVSPPTGNRYFRLFRP